MTPLTLNPALRRFEALIGTGGIGSGMFVALSGNHTLGREESRGARIVDRRDYCKLHIIAHYVAVLMGRSFKVTPVGRVGSDAAGGRVVAEMSSAGMDLRHVHALDGEQTLYSICFLYPDGSGGNITTEDSACSRVDEAAVREAEPELREFGGRAMVLAAPEVPLAARRELLDLASRHGAFRAASFTSGEIQGARQSGMLGVIDYLAINIHEAAALASEAADASTGGIVEAAIASAKSCRSEMMVSITAGREGSWLWDGRELQHRPAFPVEVASTAGAGDAFVAGILSGIAAGLDPMEAHDLASLVAAYSVTSPHTIHPSLDREALREFAESVRAALPAEVDGMLSRSVR